MSITESQTVPGTDQFTAMPGAGFWSFQQYNSLPRTTAIVIDAMAYTEDVTDQGPVRTACAFLPFLLGTAITDRMIWARDDSQFGDLINPVTGNAAKTFRGYRLPRVGGNGGTWWDMYFATLDKDQVATATISWYLMPDQLGT